MVQVLVVGLSFLVALVFFAMGMRFGTVYAVTWGQVLPGAVVSSVAWLLLQQFGIAYVGRVVQNSGDAYGVFAVVLGLVGFLFITAQIVVLSVEVNVVRAKRLWPRALLAPFTDDVELTEADQRIYEDVAAATTVKDYQEVEVRFDQPESDPEPVRPEVPHPDGQKAGGLSTPRRDGE